MDGPRAVIPQAERQQDRRNALFLPAPKLLKVFGRPTSQTPAQAASWDKPSSSTSILSPPRSPSTTISKSRRRKPQRVVSPEVVASILDGMYAYPVNRESNRHSPTKYRDKASLHHGSSLGTVASGTSGMSKRSSENPLHQVSPTIKPNHGTRGHTSSKDFPPNNYEPESSNTRHMDRNAETQPGNSQDGGATVRIVGRGGSGSRLRVVTSTPSVLEIDPSHHREQPASLPRSTHPGAGGSRSRQKPVSPAPPLLSILRRRKQKGPNSKGKEREFAHTHPVSLDLSYQIANESTSTFSTIRFSGEEGVATPSFFPLDKSSERSKPDKISLPLSSSTSTFDSIVEEAPFDIWTSSTEDLDLDLYLEDTPCPSSEERRKKSMEKIARTLGNLPHEDVHGISPRELPGKREFIPNRPRPFIDDEPTKKDPKKAFRRASLSLSGMSSVFVRPAGPRPRNSVKSHHSLSTITDDLHQLNMVDDFSDSSSASPGSPILFSPPSPSTARPPNAAMSNPNGVEVAPESLSTSTPTLSRSNSYSHTPRRRSESLSRHSLSAPTSLSSHDHSTISASSAWLFPPSDHHEEVTFSTGSNATKKPQSWTGEWNGDIDDVIRALRSLR